MSHPEAVRSSWHSPQSDAFKLDGCHDIPPGLASSGQQSKGSAARSWCHLASDCIGMDRVMQGSASTGSYADGGLIAPRRARDSAITIAQFFGVIKTEFLKDNQQDRKPPKGKNGGARPGAGRPKGKLSKLNEQRQKAKKRFIERVNKMVDPLFDAQATIALGTTYLYRVDHDEKGHALPAVIETDPKVIKDYIDGKL
jgi:hypothetical protein